MNEPLLCHLCGELLVPLDKGWECKNCKERLWPTEKKETNGFLKVCIAHKRINSGQIWVSVSNEFFDQLGKHGKVSLNFQSCDKCEGGKL